MHSSHSGVSLALDIFISPGFLKCRVTYLIAGDLWTTFIVDGCNDHQYFFADLCFRAKASTNKPVFFCRAKTLFVVIELPTKKTLLHFDWLVHCGMLDSPINTTKMNPIYMIIAR